MREIAIEVEKNHLQSISNDPGTIVKVVSCRPHNTNGVEVFVEIMSNLEIKNSLERIENRLDTESVSFKIFDKFRASGIIVCRSAPICKMLALTGGFCKNCPLEFGSAEQPKVKWRVVFKDTTSANDFLKKIAEEGINVDSIETGDLKENGLLTLREEQSVRLAEELGFFNFPRKTNLRKLSSILGISPSTLDEILRRAQYKIVKGHVRVRDGDGFKNNTFTRR